MGRSAGGPSSPPDARADMASGHCVWLHCPAAPAFFLKPLVTRRAARNYGYDFHYQSRPEWTTYSGELAFARAVRDDIRDLRPRDMIDLQSFIWVQGSDEY